jgi:hypothetical protein
MAHDPPSFRVSYGFDDEKRSELFRKIIGVGAPAFILGGLFYTLINAAPSPDRTSWVIIGCLFLAGPYFLLRSLKHFKLRKEGVLSIEGRGLKLREEVPWYFRMEWSQREHFLIPYDHEESDEDGFWVRARSETNDRYLWVRPKEREQEAREGVLGRLS